MYWIFKGMRIRPSHVCCCAACNATAGHESTCSWTACRVSALLRADFGRNRADDGADDRLCTDYMQPEDRSIDCVWMDWWWDWWIDDGCQKEKQAHYKVIRLPWYKDIEVDKDSRSDEYSSLYKRILLALWQKESASQYATPDALLKKVQTPWYGRDVCSDEICSKITHLQVRQRLSGMAFWCRLFSPLDKKRGCACAETSMTPCLCIFARNNDQGLQWSRQSLNSTDRY